jgi:hypothetical protein
LPATTESPSDHDAVVASVSVLVPALTPVTLRTVLAPIVIDSGLEAETGVGLPLTSTVLKPGDVVDDQGRGP